MDISWADVGWAILAVVVFSFLLAIIVTWREEERDAAAAKIVSAALRAQVGQWQNLLRDAKRVEEEYLFWWICEKPRRSV
ncbi:MAG: hypothetical protein V1705_02250 [bacterium]